MMALRDPHRSIHKTYVRSGSAANHHLQPVIVALWGVLPERDWFNGRTKASQALDTGPIPVSRSNILYFYFISIT